MMNFIPSKTAHEELELQNKSMLYSNTNFTSTTYLKNIHGDQDSNEGNISDEEYEDYEQNLSQNQQIYDNQNIQAGMYYRGQNQQNNSLQYTNIYGQQVNTKNNHPIKSAKIHNSSLSMKENVPQKNNINYGNNQKTVYSQNIKQNFQHQNEQYQYQPYQGPLKSFEKQYSELTQQILSQRLENVQQMNYQLQPQDLLLGEQQLLELQKREYYDQKTQNDLFKRLNKEAEFQQGQKQQLVQEQQRKEMEQCPFAPQIMTNRVEEQRSLSKFLEDQDKFQKIQNEKINLLRFQIQEEKNQNSTYQPRINSKSEMIVQMKRVDNEKVHDRLYKISKEKADRKDDVRTSNQSNATSRTNQRKSNYYQSQRTSEYEQQLEQQNTFQPQINEKSKMMLRKGKVGDHLYQDALRRQEKITTQQESVMLKEKSTMSSKAKIVSNKTEQIVAMKFVREFENVCDEILNDPNTQKINYLQMGEILNQLYFLKSNGANENENLTNLGQERKLVYDIWYNLRGDELDGVTKCNLCQLLLIIIGIFGFQLQTEEQLQQLETLQNENNFNNHNFANPLSIDTANSGRTYPVAQATLYLQERYSEEDEGDNEYNGYMQQRRGQQSLHSFNQGNEFFQAKLHQFTSNQKERKGFIDQIGNWNLPADEAKSLQKEFDILYRNRLCNEQLKKTDFKEVNSFQPQINVQSINLAENYREKLLEETSALIQNQELQVKIPLSGKITHVDLLLLQRQAQLQEREKKNIQQNLNAQNNCTFHPQTLSSSNSLMSRGFIDRNTNATSNSSQSNNGGVKKSTQLYNLSKLKGQKKDKNRNDIEYEKNFDECTFQPDIAITRSKSSNALRKSTTSNSTTGVGKDVDKVVERMRAANKVREEKNIMLQRGYKQPNEQDQKKFSKNVPVSSRIYNDTPLYRQSKGEQNSQVPYEENNLQLKEQDKQYMENNKEYNQQYLHYDQNENEEQYENQNNNNQDSSYNYTYNQEEMNRYSEKSADKISEHNGSQFQYTQIQPINPLEKVPLLFVDVNLGREKTERIIVFEGDKSEQLAAKFAEEHKLDPSMKQKLKELLDNQIAGLLTKIDEEEAPSMMSDC